MIILETICYLRYFKKITKFRDEFILGVIKGFIGA